MQIEENVKEKLLGFLSSQETEKALEIFKTALEETISMCANCHAIRDEKDEWHNIANFLLDRFGIKSSHGICPDCARKLYPEFYKE